MQRRIIICIMICIAFFLIFAHGCTKEEQFIPYQPTKRPLRFIEGNYHDIRGYIPKGGIVPDDITAIKIAEVVWYSAQGKYIYTRLPFVARLEDDSIWCVEGTGERRSECMPALMAKISKNDGRILYLEF